MTQIPAGSTIWFTGVLKAVHNADGSAITSPIRIDVRQSRITFGSWSHAIPLPDSTVNIDPSIPMPHRLWMGPMEFTAAYTPTQISNEALFDAFAYVAPEPFTPRSSGPVMWTSTFTASRPGVSITWAWSAAVYSQIGMVGTYKLKPLSGPIAQVDPQAGTADEYQNADAAGTPEAYKQNVITGAMGNGAPDYTGARSQSASVIACQSSEEPPSTASQPVSQPIMVRPPQRPFVRTVTFNSAPSFASPISQHVAFGDGSFGQAVSRCYATDLCALIAYANGDQLAIYSEGASRCQPYVVHFDRTNEGRTVYEFSRDLDRDESPGDRCPTTRATRIVMDGGRIALTIVKNPDGTLKFNFTSP